MFYRSCQTKCTSLHKVKWMTKMEVLQRKSCLLTRNLEHPISLNQTIFSGQLQPFCRHHFAQKVTFRGLPWPNTHSMCLAVSHTPDLPLHILLLISLTQTHWGTHTQDTLINPALVFFHPRQQLLHPLFPSVTEHMCFKTATFPNLAGARRSWYTTPKMLLPFSNQTPL